MSTAKTADSRIASQWAEVKVKGGNKKDLAKAVAQIRTKVKAEREIFSVDSSWLVSKRESK